MIGHLLIMNQSHHFSDNNMKNNLRCKSHLWKMYTLMKKIQRSHLNWIVWRKRAQRRKFVKKNVRLIRRTNPIDHPPITGGKRCAKEQSERNKQANFIAFIPSCPSRKRQAMDTLIGQIKFDITQFKLSIQQQRKRDFHTTIHQSEIKIKMVQWVQPGTIFRWYFYS